jgi:hydroxymethylglutaryl-CoA synthase
MKTNDCSSSMAGISGMALYVPRLHVDLESWCQWTGNNWEKVNQVAGHGFRLCSPRENVYTMASNAVLRLIEQYELDPQRIGMLALGTESSRDNAAGAVIVRGMVDQALVQSDRPPLSRSLEVPEFKHACLAGVYAAKAALRYVSSDGRERDAIVVASDIAEYERGSSGEQTQGAGAVAMLVQREPKMLRIDLQHSGSASAYRGPDFRKPFGRHFFPGYADRTRRLSDFPVFSGKYSAMSYLDEVAHAVDDMLEKNHSTDADFYRAVRALFFHRPYQKMPIQAMSFLFVRSLARDARHRAELETLCRDAGLQTQAVAQELSIHPDHFDILQRQGEAMVDPYPSTTAVAKVVRGTPEFQEFLSSKMSLGNETMRELGNLYSAALPAWLAAGIDDAWQHAISLTDEPMVMVGYGSGDAAEAIPISLVKGWEASAQRIHIARALANPLTLTQEQYEGLHDGSLSACPDAVPSRGFFITRVGTRYDRDFQDLGVEYYKFVDGQVSERHRGQS